MNRRPERTPNVVLILADDLGFSDIGCYGSEIRTPHLDSLARDGVRMSSFYNTARCSPSRASLLTGLHPHQTGVGILTGDTRPAGYPGDLDSSCATMADLLSTRGYRTSGIGKWHLARDVRAPNDAWPTRRGFDAYWGPLGGACSYFDPTTMASDETLIDIDEEDFHLTEQLSERAAQAIDSAAGGPEPFFLYLPFTAPHWPLHARPEDIDSYRGVYDRGWDAVRQDRLQAMTRLGVFDGPAPALAPRDPNVPAWDETADQGWQARRMQTYAAQVTAMDQAIGRVLDALERTGSRENTMVLFLSDNGGCAEEIAPGWADDMAPVPYNLPTRTRAGTRVRKGNAPWIDPGGADTFASYGRPWANVSNTPFREYKHWVHEGGIATPLIVSWPGGGLRPGWDHSPHQLTDVLPTVLDAVGTSSRTRTEHSFDDLDLNLEGRSMLATWRQGATIISADGSNPADTSNSTDTSRTSPPSRTSRPANPAHPLFFEHEGHGAIRRGVWKCVRKHGGPWELYDMIADRTETTDLAPLHPALVEELAAAWQHWAERCGVKDRHPIEDQSLGTPRPGLIEDISSASTREQEQEQERERYDSTRD